VRDFLILGNGFEGGGNCKALILKDLVLLQGAKDANQAIGVPWNVCATSALFVGESYFY
jgi:hypothetical protein